MPLPPRAITLRDGWALSSPLTMDVGPYAPAHVPAAIRLDVGERGWILIPLGVKLHRSNPELPTSALGQKRTSAHLRVMSALPPKADIRRRELDVRFVPKADIGLVKVNAVSQAPKIGVQAD